jgi:CoA binding domain
MSSKFDLFDILIGNENDIDYKKKPIIIQGITGSFGSTHTKLMKDYGTNIVAGVTPGKGNQSFEDIPVFNTVLEAVKNNPVEISGRRSGTCSYHRFDKNFTVCRKKRCQNDRTKYSRSHCTRHNEGRDYAC